MIEKKDAKSLVHGLHYDASLPLAIGCNGCPDRSICGGMQVAAPVFNCMIHCKCDDPNKCNIVCPKNVDYVQRVHEVRGFGFENIPKLASLPTKSLPNFAHLLFDYPRVAEKIALETAAIPFSMVFKRFGNRGIALTKDEICEKFKLRSDVQLILSGVEQDNRVEKWWAINEGRSELLAGIRAVNPLIVTTPNFSAFLDTPRHDVMHNLKRIALAWAELHAVGVRMAFHVNGLTDQDYKRLTEFLKLHTEIDVLSLEFETGAANDRQGAYHVAQVRELIQKLGRATRLIFRGDARWVPSLRDSFSEITLLNGSASMKTRYRRRALISDSGKLRWEKSLTEPGVPLDHLLNHNFAHVEQSILQKLNGEPSKAIGAKPRAYVARKIASTVVDSKADNKSPQLSLL